MDWERARKVLGEAMHPAPSVWDWVQITVLIIAVVGGAALVGWLGGVVPAIVMVVMVVALLFL